MFTTPILATYYFTKTFIVESDASGHEIGAILMQDERTLSFENIQIKGKNLLKTIYENKCWPYYMQLRNDTLT
jgi:hypothetical protein